MLGNLLKNNGTSTVNSSSSPSPRPPSVKSTVTRQSSMKYVDNFETNSNYSIENKNMIDSLREDSNGNNSDRKTISNDVSPSISAVTLNNDNNTNNNNNISSQSASMFLRSLLESSKSNNSVSPVNTTDNSLGKDEESDINNEEEEDTPTVPNRKDSIRNYPKILSQIADDSKLELFGCKMMPISKNMENESFISLNPTYPFRILVAEETEQMACRSNFKLFLDHSYPRHSDISKIRPNELRQYMFCSLFRVMNSKKYNKNEKFRVIPNSDYMILTRIFYLNSPYNRIAINLCLPKFLLPVITEIWCFIQNWWDESQRILTKIILEHKRNPSGLKGKKSLHDIQDNHVFNNKNMLGNSAPTLQNIFLQTYSMEFERIISILKNYLLPCFKSTFEIPRLFLFPPDDIKFVETWFRGCFKWIELKDGPKLNLLQTSLATVIVNYKRMLLASDDGNSKENSRIIVLSGNVTVANKLIFLLCGLLNRKIRQNLNLINQPRSREKITTPVKKVEGIAMQSRSSLNKGSIESSPSSVSSFTSMTSTMSNSSRYNYSRNGWEIPQRMGSSSASIAISPADSTTADVIQPSSFKSGHNSVRYLSSSLSSQQNSYGSWFASRPSITRMLSKSPSVTESESPLFRAPPNGMKATNNFHKTSSSTSLHQMGLVRNNPVPYHASQESISMMDFEESLWDGTPESMNSIDLYYAPTNRTLTPNVYSTSEVANDGTSFPSPLKDLNIQRDCQRIDESTMLDNAFDVICAPESDDILTADHPSNFRIITPHEKSSKASVIDIDINLNEEIQESVKFNELLPRYAAYLPNLNRFYQIQANPYGNETDSHILTTMRKDLRLNPNISVVKTLVISLQTREIYEMMVKQHEIEDKGSQRMRRIFKNGKFLLKHSSSSKNVVDCTRFIDSSFERVRTIYREIDSDSSSSDDLGDSYTSEILNIFNSIVNYSNNL
ncbi:similar to Saccharomyces cerevisiae YKL176C LST4 Protein possibly involved in a post-Golgi secretory pathway [Maudiozyma barnettii]|uniref:Protein LST4 n=1 Tax=Maudiozyma barnettii TaxID=61262 RepID=A0A8H2ZJX1_9SACH|nr:Lst4p [Kazachstania barnettii]CAB4254632.1 similar to Saccharomyces cerevisiae YKL176C LST4 Protein possibly involved in a post-Golgi secretory pathway [Kazachstania barnettii]CAD1782674.1 similar to Saccharomyces cerevisiae YKL176C LST4 Protein possibly involved in a post-Golgi secretory pathway [Kazachstania barnettii]